MTRWAIVADLRRCVGCQTCTAACKQANGTPPGVQWRRVLDLETGEYPAVKRAFVPVGCMHCDEPPCMDVCPICSVDKPRRTKDGRLVREDVANWLLSCAGCGMCEQSCPQHKPLSAVFSHIRKQIEAELA